MDEFLNRKVAETSVLIFDYELIAVDRNLLLCFSISEKLWLTPADNIHLFKNKIKNLVRRKQTLVVVSRLQSRRPY